LAEPLHIISHLCAVIGAVLLQWLGVIRKIATFPRFSQVLKKHLETNTNRRAFAVS